jgi:hypothetical protein
VLHAVQRSFVTRYKDDAEIASISCSFGIVL